MAGMKYLIIGSNSFSGSHMVDLLLKDESNLVVGISRSMEKKPLYLPYWREKNRYKFQFQICDVRNTHLLLHFIDEFMPDCIINYVAQTEVHQSSLTPTEYFETNTLAVVKLCDELRKRDYLKLYIHISSSEIYGNCNRPVNESTPPSPTTAYAVSKAAADSYLITLFKHHSFPVIIIRSTNVYGKHQQLYKIIPRTIIRLIKGKKIELHNGGQFVRPFIHIEDACQGVKCAIERGKPGDIYHFSDGPPLPIIYSIRRICEKMDYDFKESTVSVEERTGHDLRYWLDCSRTELKLNWIPEVHLDDGLDGVIQWVKNNWEEISKEPHDYIHKA